MCNYEYECGLNRYLIEFLLLFFKPHIVDSCCQLSILDNLCDVVYEKELIYWFNFSCGVYLWVGLRADG